MITVLHGDDTTASRNALQLLKEKEPDSKVVNGNSLDMTVLSQLFDSDSFISESKTVFIEELLIKKKQSGDFEAILSFLNNRSDTDTIYIWENKEVSKTVLNKLKKAISRPYLLPKSLFQFLDSISPGNTTQSLALFHKTLTTSEPELIFYMLVRHFRLLLAIVGEADIEETRRMQSWQKSKMKKIAESFSKERLISIYTSLSQIDYNTKTGGTPHPLSASIDIFLLSL